MVQVKWIIHLWCSEFARKGVDLSLLVSYGRAEDNGCHDQKILYFNAVPRQKCESDVYRACVGERE